MSRFHFGPALAATLALLLTCASRGAAAAEPVDINQPEWPARPAPKWVRGAVDQGSLPDADPALKAIITPEGFKLDLVAREPVIMGPQSLTFGDDGTPYIIEWKKTAAGVHGEDYQLTYQDGSKRALHRFAKRGGSIEGKPHTADWLKALHDKDGDGNYESHTVIMDDLQMPSACLIHDGWFYFTSQGRVIRRRQSEPGGKFDITETLVRGLPAFGRHQASGLTMSADGWLFITAGDDDCHAEGSDGSRVDLYRTGGIFMCRPDGSRLQLYARGFRNPYGSVVFDQHQNMFHVDGGRIDPLTEASAKWQGTRLIHVLEEADYGWRLEAGYRCCVPDEDRGAVSGERPGKMPVMMRTGQGGPAGLLYTSGHAMPEHFRGWLIQPDPKRRMVRAYRVERDETGSSFKVVEQFDLITSEDESFRPMQAVQGPDGAIYIVDSRRDMSGPLALESESSEGRIYRLSWSGAKGLPEPRPPSEPRPSGSGWPSEPIAPGPMNAWAKVGAMSNVQLWQELNTTDMELRKRVVNELVRRGEKNKETFIAVAKDSTRPVHARIAALGAAVRLAAVDQGVIQLAADLLQAKDADLRKLAVDALARRHDPASAPAIFQTVSAAMGTETEAAVRRSFCLALGTAAKLGAGTLTGEQKIDIWLALTLEPESRWRLSRFHYDGVVRGLERSGSWSILQFANVAIDQHLALPLTSQLRVADAADVFDFAIASGKKLNDRDLVSLFAAYRSIETDQPPDMTAVGDWLLNHPDASEKVQVAAIETMVIVGGVNTEKVLPILEKALAHDVPRVRLAMITNIERQRLHAAAPLLAKVMLDAKRPLDERRAALKALAALKPIDHFAAIQPVEKGVGLVTKELAKLVANPAASELHGDALRLLIEVDAKQAEPGAVRGLNSGEPVRVAATIDLMSGTHEGAMALGRWFAEGKLDRALLPQIVAALRKHALIQTELPALRKQKAEAAALIAKVYAAGLLAETDVESLNQLEIMVKTNGDAARGRAAFLDVTAAACIFCHQIEGVAGRPAHFGPDLTGIGQRVAAAKLIEAIIDPSKEVAKGFEGWTLTDTGGNGLHGRIVAENDKAVTIREEWAAEDMLYPRAAIKSLERSSGSLMPADLAARLTYEQLIDLVAFLKDEPAQQALRGVLGHAWVIKAKLDGVGPGDVDEKEAWEAKPDRKATLYVGGALSGYRWEMASIGPDLRINLRHAGVRQAGYVLTYLHSPVEQKAQVKFTVAGAARITVNGEGQVKVDVDTKAHVNLPLKKGWNTLLARVVADDKGAIDFGMQIIAGEGVQFGSRGE